MISLSLLGGAKVLNVCVPFLFKGAIDGLNVLQMGTPVETTATVISSLLIGCKISLINKIINNIISSTRWHCKSWCRRFQRAS